MGDEKSIQRDTADDAGPVDRLPEPDEVLRPARPEGRRPAAPAPPAAQAPPGTRLRTGSSRTIRLPESIRSQLKPVLARPDRAPAEVTTASVAVAGESTPANGASAPVTEVSAPAGEASAAGNEARAAAMQARAAAREALSATMSPPEPPGPAVPAVPAIAGRAGRRRTQDFPARASRRDRRQIPAVPASASRADRRHVAWLATLSVFVLLTAAGTAIALIRAGSGGPSPSASGGSQPRGGSPGAPLAAAAAIRAQAAAWVAREIGRSAIVGCDTVMCGALTHAGVPSSDLQVLMPTASDPLGSDVIVATSTLRSQFGHRLATEYAPQVLASFGSGPALVQVRAVALEGAAAYKAELRRQIAAQRSAGGQLLRNSRLAFPAAARSEVAAGDVDPRLLAILVALAYQHPVQVLGFYDRPPGSSPGVPLTGVLIAGTDPASGVQASSYKLWLLRYLRNQRAPFQPASITTERSGGQTAVAVRFARPTPTGLLH
jgi:hypothetical protein